MFIIIQKYIATYMHVTRWDFSCWFNMGDLPSRVLSISLHHPISIEGESDGVRVHSEPRNP